MISKKEFTEQVERLCMSGKADVISAILKICENKISDDCKIYHLDNHYSKGEHPIGNTKLMELI